MQSDLYLCLYIIGTVYHFPSNQLNNGWNNCVSKLLVRLHFAVIQDEVVWETH